ncbi:MAG: hypothetical protein QS721_07605 [Candidatus Endonucleobacter sp. (ex Gigantidas childressi)]|nr:hypothetical protein [Candidatus Endonucleobacter sp. (ex Gigantidas childressi)]
MSAAFTHPDHLLLVGSRVFAYLLPSSNLKCFGYISHFFLIVFLNLAGNLQKPRQETLLHFRA